MNSAAGGDIFPAAYIFRNTIKSQLNASNLIYKIK